jgi:predicted dehydrogenase
MDRRTMIKGAGASVGLGLGMAMSARSYARIRGANDRLRVAIVGVNGRGQAHMSAFSKVANVDITHFCDVDSAVLAKRAAEFAAKGHPAPKTESDYRRLFASKAVDIITVATPDHWHAKLAIDAMKTGHHVYCEKPIGIAPAEGEAMIAAQKSTGRRLQVGNQQRSSPETRQLLALVQAGELGDVYEAQTWYANDRKSIGKGQMVEPPANLNWDMWQGPRPRAAYRSNLVPYNWHWFWQYGTGEICNNAMHELDVARWLMGLTYPTRVEASGAKRFHRGDDWEMYDSLALALNFDKDRVIRWNGQSCNAMLTYGRGRGVLLLGTKGSAVVDATASNCTIWQASRSAKWSRRRVRRPRARLARACSTSITRAIWWTSSGARRPPSIRRSPKGISAPRSATSATWPIGPTACLRSIRRPASR